MLTPTRGRGCSYRQVEALELIFFKNFLLWDYFSGKSIQTRLKPPISNLWANGSGEYVRKKTQDE